MGAGDWASTEGPVTSARAPLDYTRCDDVPPGAPVPGFDDVLPGAPVPGTSRSVPPTYLDILTSAPRSPAGPPRTAGLSPVKPCTVGPTTPTKPPPLSPAACTPPPRSRAPQTRRVGRNAGKRQTAVLHEGFFITPLRRMQRCVGMFDVWVEDSPPLPRWGEIPTTHVTGLCDGTTN